MPSKRISREAMATLRLLRQTDPEHNTIAALARRFGISVEAVVRILKSKYEPSAEALARQETAKKQHSAQRRSARRQGEVGEGATT